MFSYYFSRLGLMQTLTTTKCKNSFVTLYSFNDHLCLCGTSYCVLIIISNETKIPERKKEKKEKKKNQMENENALNYCNDRCFKRQKFF